MRKEPVILKNITYVGFDVHKASISVAVLLPERSSPLEWTDPNTAQVVRRLGGKLKRLAPGEIQTCYEAGPCGYVLQRQLRELDIPCDVVAPSLIPRKPGERIKTDRRDARKLVELLRAGLLTTVRPPTSAEEAVRDLCRCREDVREDLLRARHRLGKFLLRRGLTWEGRSWSVLHLRWIRSLQLEAEADRVILASYLLTVEQEIEKLKSLDAELEKAAQGELFREPVAWLRCFRGVDTVTALTFVAEIHDIRRFHSARALMAYLGLVPSESSSGEKEKRGAITRAGNAHARRVLVEAAWQYRHLPKCGAQLKKRRKGQPPPVIALADKAQRRLFKRYRTMFHVQRKPHNKVVVAIARELAGFLWAALTQLKTAA